MRLVIIHHHLNTGGVTNVIHSQCSALKELHIRPLIVIGNADKNDPDPKYSQVWPELQYLPSSLGHEETLQQLNSLRERFRRNLNPKKDRLHIHNLNLGKNPLLNVVVWEWLNSGGQVVNHCHDFAEDGRPQNILHLKQVMTETLGLNCEKVLYPKASSCRYAVINGYDRQRLLKHKVPEEHIFDCPNAIEPIPDHHTQASRELICDELELNPNRKIFTYPVRAIRRKNIAEFLFIAALFHDKAHFILTQAPKNPAEKKQYLDWVDFSNNCSLPVTFEAGDKVNFHDIMAGTDAAITTSIQEGFGMVFLEPWLWKKMVFGRDLPEVTSTFKQKGLDLSSLYQDITLDGTSFPQLPSSQQKNAISKSLSHSKWRQCCIKENNLGVLMEHSQAEELVAQEQHVKKHYSISAYADSLAAIYATFI